MRCLLSLAFFALATAAAAQTTCDGRDLRSTLTADETAELEARISATPYAEGNHWIAERAAQTIHVVGTVHIDDPRLDAVEARLAPVVEAADLVLLEATEVEKSALQEAVVSQPDLVFIMEGPTLPSLMAPDAWEDLKAAAIARGIPGFMAAKFQPWYLSVILAMPPCAVETLRQTQNGLDKRLMDVATAAGVETRALEPYDTIFQLVGSEPLDQQIEYLKLGVLPDQVAEDGLTTLLAAYFDDTPAEVVEITRITTRRHVDIPDAELDAVFDDMLETLVDTRNRAWMPRILAAPDGLTVVAVGAGHLPGEVGLLRLLEDAGFSLSRQTFN